MDCAACARTVERAVAALDGVNAAQVSFGAGTLTVDGDAPAARITGAVGRAGYRARPAERRAGATGRAPFWRRDLRAASTTAAVLLLLLAVASSLASAPRAVSEPLYLLSMAVGGWPIARAAAGALRRRTLDMNVLMALAAVGAVGIGAYAEGAWVLVLFGVGTALESLALDRSRLSVESLMELAPAQARVVSGGAERLVDAAEVTGGMHVSVRPGERLALDGVVTEGASSVDQAPITGESVPVDKLPGDDVFAGTLNGHGALTVRVTRPAAEIDALARRRAGRGGAGEPGPVRALHRSLRAHLHAARLRRGAGARDGAARLRRRPRHLDLPRPRAPDRRVPLLARHLGPGRRRLRRRRRRPPRHPDQGRSGARGSRRGSGRSRSTRPAR